MLSAWRSARIASSRARIPSLTVERAAAAPTVVIAHKNLSSVRNNSCNDKSLSTSAQFAALRNGWPSSGFRQPTRIAPPTGTSTRCASSYAGITHRIQDGTKYSLIQHENFEVLCHEDVKEHSATVTVYKHKLSGAQIMSIQSEEEEKVFGVVFPTPVNDDSGVAHILEHSVLCGSKKYPAKEPFVLLLKSSLKTYLNAMTYPDRTVYPVASPNTQDFYNLVNVYCDAVFNPRLEPWVLQQEGWHYEIDEAASSEVAPTQSDGSPAEATEPSSGKSLKGVVFNEMKGVYSSPESIRSYETEAALFPDTEYRHSSGGDPLRIPELTYNDFMAFHAKYYHPSNAKVFWYGDDNVAKRLELTDSYLSEAFLGRPQPTVEMPHPDIGPNTVKLQPLLDAPRTVNRAYPCSAAGDEFADEEEGEGGEEIVEEAASAETSVEAADSGTADVQGAFTNLATQAGVADKHDVTVNWVLNGHPKDLDETTRMGLGVLNHLLMQTQVATVYKALTDSALGSAVIGGGYDDSMIQATFSAGLKGVKGANVAAAEALVLQVLKEAAESGFTPDHIESSMNTIEFNLREFAHGGNPRGLSLFLGTIPAWIYGRDPVDELKFEAPLQNLKAAIAGNPRYFQDLISRFLVNNKHRVTLHMYPDPSFSEAREAAEAEQVEKHFKALDENGVKQVKEIQQQLQLRQATPDPPEVAASVPSLHVSDLPKDTKVIPKVIKQLGSSAAAASVDTNTNPISHMLLHDQPTNGISYSSIYFDLEALPVHLLPYLPLFTWCLTSCGTAKTSQVDVSHQLGTHTGGIGASTAIYEVPGVPDVAHAYLGIGGKALHNKTDKMASLMHELVLTANLNKKDRILHYLRSTISRHESGLVSGGHRYASSLLSAQYTKPGWINDVLGGLTQLQAARVLLDELNGPSGNESFDRVVHSLEEIRRLIIQQHNVFLSITGDASTLTTTEASLLQFVKSLPASTNAPPAGTRRKGVNWKWPVKGVSKEHADKSHLPHWPFPHLFAKDAGTSSLTPTHIGIVVPTQVNYVVKAAPGFDLSPASKYVPSSAEVLTNILNTGYLWDRVRVQGGAYGGFAGINRFSGLMSFASYRDPNLGNTLNVYDATSSWLRGLQKNREATQGDIDKSIISTIGGIDAPMSPEERGSTSTARFLTGITQEDVVTRRKQILGTSVDDLSAIADAARRVEKEGRVVVVGSEAAFTEYHEKNRDKPMFELTRPLQQKK